MPPMMQSAAVAPTVERLTLPLRPAKASLEPGKKVHLSGWELLAAIMRRAMNLKGFTQKEVAAVTEQSEQALAMQLACDKRPQIERFIASEDLRGVTLIAQAEHQPDLFDVVTTITVKR